METLDARAKAWNKTGNMSLKTSLTVTATGEEAFKLLALINEAGLDNSVSVIQEQAPLEGGINLNELPYNRFTGVVSDKAKEEAFAAGQGIVQMSEEDFLKLMDKTPEKDKVTPKAKKYLVKGKKTYFTASVQKSIRKEAAEGVILPDIARKLGIPYQSLRHWVMKNGIDYRKDNRGRKPRS